MPLCRIEVSVCFSICLLFLHIPSKHMAQLCPFMRSETDSTSQFLQGRAGCQWHWQPQCDVWRGIRPLVVGKLLQSFFLTLDLWNSEMAHVFCLKNAIGLSFVCSCCNVSPKKLEAPRIVGWCQVSCLASAEQLLELQQRSKQVET